jgi:hypothetical protein
MEKCVLGDGVNGPYFCKKCTYFQIGASSLVYKNDLAHDRFVTSN